MSRAIDDLRQEHQAILSALEILDSMGHRLMATDPVESADLALLVGFLREFVDKCHHGKEEGFLFPAMVAAGLPREGGPLGVLLDEHAQGRVWIGRMQASLQPALDAHAFAAAARGYRELLAVHLQKENSVLFPMAERALAPAQLEQLFEAFEKHEREVMGPHRHEQLHATLHELRSRYLVAT